MIQWKDKVGKNQQNVLLGFFVYFVLMVVDILIYYVIYVFVGEDQKQYFELICDIVIKFNNDYGVDFFLVIELVIEGVVMRVMFLCDGSKKMLKFDLSDVSCINMIDDMDMIVKKICKVKIDFEVLFFEVKGFEEWFEVCNFVNIYVVLVEQSVDQVFVDVGGKQFLEFKLMFLELVVEKFVLIFGEMVWLMQY